MALGTTQATLEYIIRVQDRDLKDLKKQLQDTGKVAEESQSQHSKLAGAIGGVAKTAALAAGAAGLAGLAATAKIGFDEFSQGQKVAAQTAAVLKSTGGAANVSAKQIDEMASSMLRKTGIDDETIKSGENLLLTFRNIKNEAGQGNDIFTQTTSIMTDMSVALGEDTSSAAIQLGKALNDPIKGVTALQRVGVSFTADQREQIKTLVDSGKTMDAQKLILHELTKEFGGSAEAVGKTLPGQINIAKETFRNWAGELVGKTIPVIEDLISWLRDHWPEIQKVINAFWNNIKPILGDLKDILLGVAGIIEAHWPLIEKYFNQLWSVAKPILDALHSALKLIVDLLHGDWAAAWDDAKNVVSNLLTAIKNLITAEVMNIYNVAKTIGDNVKSAVLAGVGDVGKWFKESVIDPIVNKITAFPGQIVDFSKDLFTKFTGFFTSADIGAWIGERLKAWAADITAIPGKIADFGTALYNTVTGFITNAGIGTWVIGKVEEWAGAVGKLPGKIASALADGVKGAWQDAKDAFMKLFSWLPGWAKDALGIHSPSKVFMEIGEHIVSGLIEGLKGKAGDLQSAAETFIKAPIDWVAKTVGGALHAAGGFLNIGQASGAAANMKIGQTMASAYGWSGGSQWDALVQLWNQESGWNNLARNPSSGAYGIPQALPASKMGAAANPPLSDPGNQIAWGLGYIKSRYGSPLAAWAHEQQYNWYHTGGIVQGAPKSNQLAVLQAGEGVFTADQMAAMGGLTVYVTVEGSVISERDLVDVVYNGLLQKQTRMPLRLS